MFGTNGLIIWLLGGAGTFLLYSAISNQKPQDVLTKYLGSTSKTPGAISTWKSPTVVAATGGATGKGSSAAPGAGNNGGGGGRGAVAIDGNGNVGTIPVIQA